jgi:hypothetical protein
MIEQPVNASKTIAKILRYRIMDTIPHLDLVARSHLTSRSLAERYRHTLILDHARSNAAIHWISRSTRIDSIFFPGYPSINLQHFRR